MFSVVSFLIIGIGLYSGYHSQAAGATYYVAPYGDNSNSCSEARDDATPRETINQGVKCLSAGDTLIVKAGTYPERLTRVIPSGSSSSAPVTVKAEDAGRVTLKPSGDGFIVYFGDSSKYIVFDGFHLDGANLPPNKEWGAVKMSGKGPHSGANHITLKNLEITNIFDDSCMQVAGMYHVLSGVKITNCARAGIYWGSRNGTLNNVEVSNVGAYGIQLYYGQSAGVDNNIIRNSTFNGSARGGMYVGHGKGNMIEDNEVSDNPGGGINVRSKGNIILNNTVCDNGSYQIKAVSGNTITDNVTSASAC